MSRTHSRRRYAFGDTGIAAGRLELLAQLFEPASRSFLEVVDLGRVGLATAPADAAPDVRNRVHWVATAKGGAGAARELIELILRAQGLWDTVMATYLPAPEPQQS